MKIVELNLSIGKSIFTSGLFILLSSSVATLNAQTAIVPAGAEATGTGGTCSYTVGQMVYVTISDNTTSLAQGVQQPFEISTVVSVAEAECFELQMSIYPNPSRNVFILNVGDYKMENLNYELIDASGKVVLSGKISSSSAVIDASSLAADNYYLKVIEANTSLKTFKLIKC